MRMRSGLVALVVAALAAAAPLNAQAPRRTFGWYAKLVSFDAATRTMIASAPIEPHVGRYVSSFAPGDRLVLTWAQFDGNADAVTYVAAEKAMTAKSGYVVRAKFVSADPKAATITFAVRVPQALAAALAAAKPGTPVRVGTPLLQPGPEAVLAAVALDKTAPARPAPVAPKVTSVASGRSVAGNWALDSDLMGNAVKLQCAFTQEGTKIGGMCKGPGPIGSPAVTGAVDGDEVAFQFSVAQGGFNLALRHAGKLNADGNTIEGTLDLMGNTSAFKASKQ
jgi:hypothetical protein